jgi:hypothetical protein
MGYDRIVGALANLGHEVSDQTVGNVLRRHVYRRRRSANAGPPGHNSFGSTSRCSQGRTFPRPRSLCEDW